MGAPELSLTLHNVPTQKRQFLLDVMVIFCIFVVIQHTPLPIHLYIYIYI